MKLPTYDPITGKRIGGTLENWQYFLYNKTETQDYYVIRGNIYGDTNWPDGLFLRTSYIVKLDEDNKIVETMNTIYKLGERAKNEL